MEVAEALTGALLEFHNGFASREQSVIRAGELTLSEIHAIEVLGCDGQMNMKQLARKLGVTTGTVTVTMDRLERKGSGQREARQGDRRAQLISLTNQGTQAYQEHHQYHQALTAQILGVLTEVAEAEQRRTLTVWNPWRQGTMIGRFGHPGQFRELLMLKEFYLTALGGALIGASYLLDHAVHSPLLAHPLRAARGADVGWAHHLGGHHRLVGVGIQRG